MHECINRRASAVLNDILQRIQNLYHRFFSAAAHLDGVASLLLRLIVGPVVIAAGWTKITGTNWFASRMDSFPFPFNELPPDFSWFLASWTEFAGGIALLLGLGTRLVSIPVAITMFVAAYAVHLDNGWAAIAPSNPPAACFEGSKAGFFERAIKCQKVNERTIEASKRLDRAKFLLHRHGNFEYLEQHGSFVKLNNGIEFAAIYLIMLFTLVIIGGGRYFSLDYYLKFALRRQAP